MIIKKETINEIPVYHVRKNYDDTIMTSKLNTYVEKADIKDVIDDDADVFTEDGKLLLRFRKKVIPQEKSEMFYDNIIDFAKLISSNRGNATGSDKRNGDKEWLGFWGDDLEITIDFGEETEIESVETRFHNGQGQWIYAPEKVQVSIDNNLFKDYLVEKSNELLENFQVNFEGVKGRVITLKIPSYGIIPEGKQGAGHKAWTFIDEIIIN